MEESGEELIKEFVKGPSNPIEEEPTHVIGSISEKEFRLDSGPELDKHGLELKDY